MFSASSRSSPSVGSPNGDTIDTLAAAFAQMELTGSSSGGGSDSSDASSTDAMDVDSSQLEASTELAEDDETEDSDKTPSRPPSLPSILSLLQAQRESLASSISGDEADPQTFKSICTQKKKKKKCHKKFSKLFFLASQILMV